MLDSGSTSILLAAAVGATVAAAGVAAGWIAYRDRRGPRPTGITVKVPKNMASLPVRDEPLPLKTLTDLLAPLTQRRSIAHAQEVVAEQARHATGAAYGAVFVREGSEYVLQAVSGMSVEANRNVRIGRDNPVVRYIAEGDRPAAHIAQGHPQLAFFRKLFPNVRDLVCVPLMDSKGAYGFVVAANKPDPATFTSTDIELFCYLAVPLALHLHNSMLHQELEQTYTNTIIAMAKALEARDMYSRGHSERVARRAVDFGQWLGLDKSVLQVIHRAGLLHDLGKIGVPDNVLNRTGKLNAEEQEVMRGHSEIGYEILKEVRFLEQEAFLVRHHHERHDGSGYPAGLAKEQIPEAVIVLSLADVFESLMANQPYRPAYSFENTLAEMANMSGTHFEPRYFRRFVEFITATYRQSLQTQTKVGATGPY